MTDKATPPDTVTPRVVQPSTTPPNDTGATPPLHGGPPMLSQAEAARVCKVSTATIRRARQAGKLPGAVQTADGWAIPIPELIAAGIMPRATPPDTPTTPIATRVASPLNDTGDTPRHTPTDTAVVDELRAKLAAAEQRAAVAEAVARERGLALEDARLALRALTGPAPDTAHATPTTPPPRAPETPPTTKAETLNQPAPDDGSHQPTTTPETSTMQTQGNNQPARRRWWQRSH